MLFIWYFVDLYEAVSKQSVVTRAVFCKIIIASDLHVIILPTSLRVNHWLRLICLMENWVGSRFMPRDKNMDHECCVCIHDLHHGPCTCIILQQQYYICFCIIAMHLLRVPLYRCSPPTYLLCSQSCSEERARQQASRFCFTWLDLTCFRS